ncbi:hypothetical protein [Croceicoccus sp. BE223]|uniref:hypothetical protein n=1 Tax=Croceicoccus sp. BE223 TaxID=2817716 RepID=UPI00285A6878|nr:hypothetical protein [Croceicoccus sp. BE223]MDR7102047.1 hypothetical protein [Croceicoccus sp. BE223]
MPDSPTIQMPAGYAPAYALAFRNADGGLSVVGSDTPLPTQAAVSLAPAPEPAVPAALTGQTAVTTSAGPFVPLADRPVVITLAGTWQGTVRLLRSVDGGTTRVPLTAGGLPWASYTGNTCEIAWVENESGASLYLDLSPTSGTVSYRVAQ